MYHCWQKPPTETSSLLNDPPPDPNSLPITLRIGKRTCTSHPISYFVSYDHLSSSLHAFTTSLNFVVVPKSIDEAMSIPNWKFAMDAEMSTFSQNATWSLVTHPSWKTIVRCIL